MKLKPWWIVLAILLVKALLVFLTDLSDVLNVDGKGNVLSSQKPAQPAPTLISGDAK